MLEYNDTDDDVLYNLVSVFIADRGDVQIPSYRTMGNWNAGN